MTFALGKSIPTSITVVDTSMSIFLVKNFCNISSFLFYTLGVYYLYSGPNTGIFFQIHLGLLIGIGLGGTAISIPMSIVGKHFPLSTRTIAMSIVTAVGSFGYFISPIFTNYSLINYGWNYTLFLFFLSYFSHTKFIYN